MSADAARRLCCAALLLALWLAARAVVATPTIIASGVVGAQGQPAHLIYVESPGETFSPAQRATTRAQVADALAWWDRAAVAGGLAPPGLALVEVQTAQVDDPFAPLWFAPLVTYDNPALEIYVVANHRARALLRGRFAGEAAPAYRALFAVAHAYPGLAPTVAHELGHVLYDLPDLYERPGQCRAMDLMCYPAPAYAAGTLGCRSLATLGQPCLAGAATWRPGQVVRDDGASWFYPDVPTTRPTVAVDAGGAWAACIGDEEPCSWVVSAQGPWRRLTVDGVTIWERSRVALPQVRL